MGNFNADPSPLPEKMDLFYIPNTLRRLGRLASKLFMHMPESGYPADNREPLLPPRSIPGQQEFSYDDIGTYFEGNNGDEQAPPVL